jgi:FAD/FMN-containing dehydrogenase
MNHMGPVNSLSQTVQVQAGAITQAVHQHCLPWGLAWPIEFASQGSSQVGGNISTNAGGVKVIRYGLTRNWVLGLQVVTMAGDILNLNGGLEKNNTGIDLRQLFIGSEGVLGVITEATLKLARVPETLEVFFFAVRDIKAIFNLFREARKSPFQISAFECLTENCLKVVSEIRGIASPFHTTYPAYVLVEMERHASTSQESRDEWLTHLFDAGLVLDGTLAQSLREAQSLWSLREGISESLAVKGFVHKNDIALPVFNLEQFIDEMDEVFARRHPSLEIFLFGHIGDGNLHVNTMKPKDWEQEQFVQSCQQVDLDLFELVKKYSGSVSAEHGIGLLKKSALHFSRSPEEVALMRAMKAVLDPHGLLNPGKIFDALSS